MQHVVRIQIEALPEGVFLATSDELPGLVAQGNTVAETLAIAQDIARILIAAFREARGRSAPPRGHGLPGLRDRRDGVMGTLPSGITAVT